MSDEFVNQPVRRVDSTTESRLDALTRGLPPKPEAVKRSKPHIDLDSDQQGDQGDEQAEDRSESQP